MSSVLVWCIFDGYIESIQPHPLDPALQRYGWHTSVIIFLIDDKIYYNIKKHVYSLTSSSSPHLGSYIIPAAFLL